MDNLQDRVPGHCHHRDLTPLRHTATPIPVPTAFPRTCQPPPFQDEDAPTSHPQQHPPVSPTLRISPSSTRVWPRCAQKPNREGALLLGPPCPAATVVPQCGESGAPHRDPVAALLAYNTAGSRSSPGVPASHGAAPREVGGWYRGEGAQSPPGPARGDGSDPGWRHCGQEGDARGCLWAMPYLSHKLGRGCARGRGKGG